MNLSSADLFTIFSPSSFPTGYTMRAIHFYSLIYIMAIVNNNPSLFSR